MPEILAGVYAFGFAELSRMLVASDDRSLSRVDRLWRVARGYREFAGGNAHLYQLMYSPRVRHLAPSEAERGGAAEALTLVASIIAPPDAGVPAVDAVRPFAYAFWSAIHGPVSLEAAGWLRANATEVFEGVVTQGVRAAINPPARVHRA